MMPHDDLPENLRRAAVEYVEGVSGPRSHELASTLIDEFGVLEVRNLSHTRAARLCILATRRVLPWWGADGTAPFDAIKVATKWMSEGVAPKKWDQVCRSAWPRSHGAQVFDCELPALSAIASAAA